MKYILADTAEKAEQVLRRAKDEKLGLGYDTETAGPDLKRHTPILSHSIVCFSLAGVASGEPWKACIDGEFYGMFGEVIESETIKKYDANTKFEIHVANNHHKKYRGSIVDVNLASATLDPHMHGHSVEAVGRRNLGTAKRKFREVVPDLDTMRAWIMDREDFALYSADDAMHEREIGIKMISRLENKEWIAGRSMWDYYKKYQRPYTLVLAEMEQYGILVDREYLETILKKAKACASAAAYAVVKELGWTPSRVETFINSPQQISEELFVRRKLPIILFTKGGQCSECGAKITKNMRPARCPDHPFAEVLKTPSTSDAALSRMTKDPLPYALIRYRKYAKKVEEIEKLIEAIHPITGRIHTTLRQDVARTGRLSSVAPNLQNMTSSEKEADIAKMYGLEVFDVRHAFIADAIAGFIFGDWDESQLEYRVLAHYSRDPALLEGFATNEDFHSVTAKAVYNLECAVKDVKAKHPALRSKAKNGNFCLNYGGGAAKLAFMSRISLNEAKEFIELRKANLPGIYDWWDVQKQSVYDKGYASDLIGWQRPLPEIYDDDDAIRSSGERKGINCVDFKTEALTQRGWVLGPDLLMSDVILTKNIDTGILEWQSPTDIKLYPDYVGEVVSFKSKTFDAVTTPDHRWAVTRNGAARCVLSSDLDTNGHDKIHRTGHYSGPSSNEFFTDDEIELVGWYLTDGYRKGKYRVGVCQSLRANQQKVGRIEALISRLGVRFSSRVVGSTECMYWDISGIVARKILLELPNRILTAEFLMKLTSTQARLLLETMLLGDGSIEPSRRRLTTRSKVSSDLFQMLCTLCGYASTAGWRDMSMYSPVSSKMRNIPKMTGVYIVNVLLRNTVQVAKQHKTTVTARVPMWCPMVPNTYFVARRNNKVYITGNTPIQASAQQLVKIAQLRLMGPTPEWEGDLSRKFRATGARMLLQIHDELLCEVPQENFRACGDAVKFALEHPLEYELAVPLVAEEGCGTTWSEAH